jgi:NAD(P)-dependent dehydrogenase (short-subunit alcohol dehydrogenase family)
MDITDDAAMRHLCRSVFDRWGGLCLWAHAAIHAAPLAPVPSVDAKDWEKSVKVNATATATLIPFVAPLLHAQQGTALFFDDPRAGLPFFAAYGASKAAQMALARSWQAETRRTGPRVVIAAPQPMPTATRARFHPGEDRAPLADPRTEAARILDAL